MKLFFLVFLFVSGSAFAALDEAELGKAEGYPVCTLGEMARDPKEGARMLGEGKEFILSMIKRRQIDQTATVRTEAPAQA